MLNIQPKILRDPEIFSRFLGESEKKIPELFADARHEQEMFGDRSDVHIIIFDELSSICKRRTHCDESTRDSVQHNVTTKLFAEIDGLTPIDSILINYWYNKYVVNDRTSFITFRSYWYDNWSWFTRRESPSSYIRYTYIQKHYCKMVF